MIVFPVFCLSIIKLLKKSPEKVSLLLKSGPKAFIKKYRDDLLAIIGGCGLLYFATLDQELAWFWKTAGYLLLVWGIVTLCLQLKAEKNN